MLRWLRLRRNHSPHVVAEIDVLIFDLQFISLAKVSNGGDGAGRSKLPTTIDIGISMFNVLRFVQDTQSH